MNSAPGGGGRVAVTQSGADDFSAFTGSITAYGGRTLTDNAVPTAGAGTVYLKSRAEESAQVVIDNDLSGYYRITDLVPTNYPGNVKALWNIPYVIRRGGRGVVIVDSAIGDFDFPAGLEGYLYLNGRTLTLRSLTHCNKQTLNGVYSPTWPSGRIVTGTGGKIVWVKRGFMLILQ